MKKRIKILLLLICGCSVGPKYQEPEVTFNTDYKNAEGAVEENDPIAVPLNTWWEQFQDPVLTDLVQKAVEQNLDLLVAYQRIQQVRAYYKIEASHLFPEIDFNGAITRYKISENLDYSPFLGSAIQNLFQMGFDASWEVDVFGKIQSLTNAALADLMATKEGYRSVYITLIADVCRNYTLFRSYEKQVRNLKRQVEIQTFQAKLNKDLSNSGLEPWNSFFSARAEIRALEAQIYPLETQMQLALNRMSVLLGEQPENFSISSVGQIPLAKGRVPLGLPSDLLRRRPDIRETERQLAAATNRVAASIAEFFPTFSLTGHYGWESTPFNQWLQSGSNNWSIAPSLSLPLINFGRIQAQVNANTAIQKEVFLRYQNTILKALEEVENNLYTYLKQELKLTSIELEYKDIYESYLLTDARFKAGLSPYGETLLAELNLLQIELEVTQSTQVLSESLIALYKSLGGDWECTNTP
ncbi:MAG: efflux transporter outer membrane subunit [Chlamydiia bacterium]